MSLNHTAQPQTDRPGRGHDPTSSQSHEWSRPQAQRCAHRGAADPTVTRARRRSPRRLPAPSASLSPPGPLVQPALLRSPPLGCPGSAPGDQIRWTSSEATHPGKRRDLGPGGRNSAAPLSREAAGRADSGSPPPGRVGPDVARRLTLGWWRSSAALEVVRSCIAVGVLFWAVVARGIHRRRVRNVHGWRVVGDGLADGGHGPRGGTDPLMGL